MRLTLIPPRPEQWQEFYEAPDEWFEDRASGLSEMLGWCLEARFVIEVGGQNLTGSETGIGAGLVEVAVVLRWFVHEIEESRGAQWALWYLNPMLRVEVLDEERLRISICDREEPYEVFASAECSREAFCGAAMECAREAEALARAGMPPRRAHLVDQWLSEPSHLESWPPEPETGGTERIS